MFNKNISYQLNAKTKKENVKIIAIDASSNTDGRFYQCFIGIDYI